jgi:hypothetical protein
MVYLPGPWWAAAGFSVIVTEISDLASPATAILNMSGFLLRVLVRRKRSRLCAANTGRDRPWLAGDTQEGHLLPVREEG